MTLVGKGPFCAAHFCRIAYRYAFVLACTHASAVLAAPGAHGPNGEHLDVALPAQQQTLNPRFETFSEEFELVGELRDDRLVLHLQDYETNTPIQHASIELETGGFSAHAQAGETAYQYLITDASLLAQLQKPQPHEMILTVITDTTADLLTASLEHATEPATTENAAGTHHTIFYAGAALAVCIALLLGFIAGRRGGAR